MPEPRIVSRDEWLTGRKALLAEEKAFTRARDALSAKRAGPGNLHSGLSEVSA